MSGRTADETVPVAIVGAGIGGLTLALELHRVGIRSRVYEAVAEPGALGVGINVLPHASAVLGGLGLEPGLLGVAVETAESAYFTRFGQLIHRAPAGRAAGYPDPQYSIHRGDLQRILLDAVAERLGPDAVQTDHRCVAVHDEGSRVTLSFTDHRGEAERAPVRAELAVACDGVHSVIRRQFFPDEGEPRYSGVMMWRGTTIAPPFLSGATMVRAGWLQGGKMVIYPIRNDVDGAGSQLVNWVAEVETEQRAPRDWTRRATAEDFIDHFARWRFDWLDVPALIRGSSSILEYPMVDQEPLPHWTRGRVTLLGDAAHPMVPRGSNGAGQAILDAHRLAEHLAAAADPVAALAAYEAERLPATSAVVRANRTAPPDAVIREVWQRTGDRPFDDIDAVISRQEIDGILSAYQAVAGYPLDPRAGTGTGAGA